MKNNSKERKVIKISLGKFIAGIVALIVVVFLGTNLYLYAIGKPNILNLNKKSQEEIKVSDEEKIKNTIEEELIAYLIEKGETYGDERIKEALDKATVKSYEPVYVVTAMMPSGALERAYVLVKDNDGIQILFDINTKDATTTQEILSCVQNSLTEITITVKRLNYEPTNAENPNPIEEEILYSFVKEKGKWKESE